MWSFGCILAELLTGYPLFTGEDYLNFIARQLYAQTTRSLGRFNIGSGVVTITSSDQARSELCLNSVGMTIRYYPGLTIKKTS